MYILTNVCANPQNMSMCLYFHYTLSRSAIIINTKNCVCCAIVNYRINTWLRVRSHVQLISKYKTNTTHICMYMYVNISTYVCMYVCMEVFCRGWRQKCDAAQTEGDGTRCRDQSRSQFQLRYLLTYTYIHTYICMKIEKISMSE